MMLPPFIAQLAHRLSLPLPGYSAHSRVMAYARPSVEEALQKDPPPRLSAVLVLLFEQNAQWHTLLMVRAGQGGVHSGQVSFPGGKAEKSDSSLEATALRETAEETGMDTTGIRLIGKLSQLYIPPSHFIVQPIVGFIDSLPPLSAHNGEVQRLFITPLEQIAREEALVKRRVYVPRMDAHIHTMCFELDGEVVWGATAMMLMELRELLLHKD